jgi:hypothetical protein
MDAAMLRSLLLKAFRAEAAVAFGSISRVWRSTSTQRPSGWALA